METRIENGKLICTNVITKEELQKLQNVIKVINEAQLQIGSATNVGGTSFSRDLVIDGATGNVGIGTTSPDSKLHVYQDNSTTDTTNGLLVENDGTGDAVAQFLLTGTKRYMMGIDNSDSDKFVINTGVGDLSSGNRITFDSDMNMTTVGNISGSATSTGSFGSLVISDAIQGGGNVKGGDFQISANDLVVDGLVNATERGLVIKHSGLTSNTTSLVQDANNSRGELNTKNRSLFIQAGTDGFGSGERFRILVNQIASLDILNDGTVLFPVANQKISGSSTSTGSFGAVHAADKVRIGLTNDDSPHLLEMKAGATGGDFIQGRQSDGGQAFRVGLDSGDDAFLELGSAGTSDVVVLRADGISHFNGGNVGIGTDNPESTFHISSSAAATNDFLIDSGITAGQQSGSIKIQYWNDNDYSLNFGWEPMIIGRSGNGSGRNFTIAMRNGGTPDTNDSSIHFETGGRNGAPGSIRMVIHDGGNIGIGGVTDPDSELEIFHATDPQIKFSINTHGDAALLLADADGLKIYGQGASNQIRFHCDTTEVMRIATNSLLIGKTTDATALANDTSIQAHNGQTDSGQAPAVFTKANAGHALIGQGQSAGVEDCVHFSNSSTAWGGATKGIVKITDANAGATTSNFFYCEDSGGTEARLDTNGLYYGQGTAVSSIDYAEFFESKDGQAIPFGTTVKLDGDKIVPCSDGDTPIGVIRPNEGSSVLGGNSLEWHKKYKRTDYDAYETEDYEVIEWEVTEVVKEAYTDENGDKHEAVTESRFEQCEKGKEPEGVEIPSDALVVKKTRRIVNADYDSSKTYVERKDRDEWNLVGLLGQVPITKGQPVASNWIKMRDVSENVEMYLIK